MDNRSIICWRTCCAKAGEAKEKDDGEWMEPIRNKRSKRHTAKIKDTAARRASSEKVSNARESWALVREHVDRQIEEKREARIKWADLVDELGAAKVSTEDDAEATEGNGSSLHEDSAELQVSSVYNHIFLCR